MKDHARKPRRKRQLSRSAALIRDSPLRIDCAELKEQRLCLTERGRRRSVDESKRKRIGDAAMGEIEQKPGKIGAEDLGPIRRRERSGFRFLPQAVADARLVASRSAA